LLLVVLATARPLRAGGGPATDSYDDVTAGRALDVHALVDLYLAHDFNAPPSGQMQLRAFDVTDGPSVGLLRVTLAHRPAPVGFRLDVGVGDVSDAFFAADPAASTHPELARWLSRVEQLFVSAVIPVAGGISVDVGKFATPIGLEDNEALANWSYSRSLVYTFAEPSLHSGVRLTWSRGPTALSLFWLDGWNSNFVDGHGMRSFAVAWRWRPRDALELTVVVGGGLERSPSAPADPTLAWRTLVDGYVVARPTRRLALALTGDFADDRARGGVDFWGVALAARLELTRALALAVRGELLDDGEGYAAGTRQHVGEATVTMEGRASIRRVLFVTRLEYRHDQSTAPVFDAAGGMRTTQDTLTLALIAAR
jgi:hypothetical protein